MNTKQLKKIHRAKHTKRVWNEKEKRYDRVSDIPFKEWVRNLSIFEFEYLEGKAARLRGDE